MSVADLRKELLALQKEFLGGTISTMKKHEVAHRLDALKKAMEHKTTVPEPAPMKPKSTGAPKARDIPTEKAVIAEDVEVTVPKAPVGGKRSATKHGKRTDPKVKAEPKEVKPPKIDVEEKPAAPAEKPKKVRRVPPKVLLEDDAEPAAVEAPKERKIVKKPSKATAAPKTDPPAPEPAAETPAPVVEKPVKMPGGCRRLPDMELHMN
jgi:hypothetical protein